MNSDLQDSIQAVLDAAVADGGERGAQVAIYLKGKLVVDAWAGVADVRTATPVDGDSLFPVFSTTKGIFSTVIHILAERGLIHYDQPMADYWPEFAAHGKRAITVRHALAHTAGMQYMPEGLTLEDVADWDGMCRRLAEMEPAFPAGAKQIYHPVTFGWLVGEVACRVDGRTVPQLIAEEICRPLGITQIYCGIPAEIEPRTAWLEWVGPVGEPPQPPYTIVPSLLPLHTWMNNPAGRRTPQPGCTGIMSARAIARHYAALLPGGVDGIELLSPERLRMATEMQMPSDGFDPNDNGRNGLGYDLDRGSETKPNRPPGFGHAGHGGSIGYAYPQHGLAVAFTRNRYSDEATLARIWARIHQSLGVA